MKKNIYHIPESNRKIVERCIIDTLNTQLHDRWLYLLPTSHSIKRGEVKLNIWVQTSLLSELMLPCINHKGVIPLNMDTSRKGKYKNWLHWKETTWICVISKVKVGFLTVDIFRLSVFFWYAIKCMLIFGVKFPIRYHFHEIWVSLRLTLRWIMYESSFFLKNWT